MSVTLNKPSSDPVLSPCLASFWAQLSSQALADPAVHVCWLQLDWLSPVKPCAAAGVTPLHARTPLPQNTPVVRPPFLSLSDPLTSPGQASTTHVQGPRAP